MAAPILSEQSTATAQASQPRGLSAWRGDRDQNLTLNIVPNLMEREERHLARERLDPMTWKQLPYANDRTGFASMERSAHSSRGRSRSPDRESTQLTRSAHATAHDSKPNPEVENRLAQKYGTLYAADEEKERRKCQHKQAYERFQKEADMHRMRAEHLATRNRIWAECRGRNDAEYEKCKARMAVIELENKARDVVAEELNEEFEGDVRAWEEDKVMEGKWKAFFDLETDEVDG